jgi:hypothetical protein
MSTPNPKPIDQVEQTLAFFASVIKSGESWSSTCEQEYEKAKQGLTLFRGWLDYSVTGLYWPIHCPFCGHDPKTELAKHGDSFRVVVFCDNEHCRNCKAVGMDVSDWNKRPERVVPGC